MTATRAEFGEHWAVFRGYDHVTNRQRRPWARWRAEYREGKRPARDPDFAEEMFQAVLYMYIDSWSLDEPVPVDWDMFLLWWENAPTSVSDLFAIEALRHHNGGDLTPADEPADNDTADSSEEERDPPPGSP